MALPEIILKPGKEKPVLNRHPWIFSGAIKHRSAVEPGAVVQVRAADGRFLAKAYCNPATQLTARILTWNEDEAIDTDFWRRRIAAAGQRRQALLGLGGQTAARLVMSEADLLPGLMVDKYADYLVVQALTAGIDRHLAQIVAALEAEFKPRGISERSDDATRALEGLPEVNRLLAGSEAPDAGVAIEENGRRFIIDLKAGHKTGYYLDQRLNHAAIGAISRGLKVLDCFCYTGGFTVHAAKGGAASVHSIDASAPALERLVDNLDANGLTDRERFTQQAGNAFELLRQLRDRGESYDLIILDPPKFAANAAQVDKAARGYKDINMLAFKLLRPGGVLATYSCSGHMSAELFQKIIFSAALDAGRDAQIIRYMFQADDHPVLLTFPQSMYLKGFLCQSV